MEVRFLQNSGESAEGGLWDQAMQSVDEIIDERNAALPTEPDSRKAIQDAQTDEDIGSKVTYLPPNLEVVRNRGRNIIENPETDETRPDDSDGNVITHFVHPGNDPPWGNPLEGLMVPPTNLEINNADLVAPLSHPFEEMMRLMGSPLNPIRFLEDEDAQGIQTPKARTGNEAEGKPP